HVLDFDDLLRVTFGQRATENGEVLGKHKHRTAIDRAPAGDHAVTRDLGLFHAELVGSVLDKHVELLERALVHQQLNAFSRRELPALMLGVDARLAATKPRVPAPKFKLFEDVFHGLLRPAPKALPRCDHWRNWVLCRPAMVLR